MLAASIFCVLAVTVRSQVQQQSLCMKLHGFYETICLNQEDGEAGVVAQGPAGKRGVPGTKGERGSPGLPGLVGVPGVVDYNRVRDMIVQVMQDSATTNSWPGWGKSGRRYYKCFNDRKVTYQQAKSACSGYGGRLAAEILRDPNAARYIASHCYKSGFWEPWIGYDDTVREGDWIWVDGGSMNAMTTQWRETDPSNGGGRGEDCGHIREVAGAKLRINDITCRSRLTYICEI